MVDLSLHANKSIPLIKCDRVRLIFPFLRIISGEIKVFLYIWRQYIELRYNLYFNLTIFINIAVNATSGNIKLCRFLNDISEEKWTMKWTLTQTLKEYKSMTYIFFLFIGKLIDLFLILNFKKSNLNDNFNLLQIF